MKHLIAILCLTLALLLGGVGMPSDSHADSKTKYSPSYCEYGVQFPSKPDFTTTYIPQFGNVETATWAHKESFLKAECLAIDGSKINKALQKTLIESYALQQGLSGVEYRFSDMAGGSVAQVRGYKTIANSPATYEIVVYFGRSSLMVLYAGSLSSTYPTNEIHAFLKSIHR